MSNNIKFPAYLIGDGDPLSPFVWIIRCHDPFIVGMVEPQENGFCIYCGPFSVSSTIPQDKLRRLIEEMATIWAVEVCNEASLPPQWSFVFDRRMPLPHHLVCDHPHRHFTAVLRIQSPRMWLLPEQNNLDSLSGVALDDGTLVAGDPRVREAVAESWEWWSYYRMLENTLRKLER